MPWPRRALPHDRGQRPARSDGPGSGAIDGRAASGAAVPVRGQPAGAGPLAGAWPQTVAPEPAAVVEPRPTRAASTETRWRRSEQARIHLVVQFETSNLGVWSELLLIR